MPVDQIKNLNNSKFDPSFVQKFSIFVALFLLYRVFKIVLWSDVFWPQWRGLAELSVWWGLFSLL